MVFVTGGTGLVGGHIICHLLLKGHKVKALARANSDKTWFNNQAKFLLGERWQIHVGNLQWCEGDVTDIIGLSGHLQGCSHVFHAAALVSFASKDKSELYRINVNGTANVLNACLDMEMKPDVCFISSTASIGGVENTLVDESEPFSSESASSYYSYTKYLAELEAFRSREEGLNVAIINPCIVLGFGNWEKGPSKFFKNGKKGFPFYTTGRNGFVDARDVADAAILMMEKRVFTDRYLCTGWNKKFVEVFQAISNEFGSKPPRIKINRFRSEVAWRLAGIWNVFTGHSLITKASTRAGMKEMSFSSQKLMEKCGFKFRDFEESIKFSCASYEKMLKE